MTVDRLTIPVEARGLDAVSGLLTRPVGEARPEAILLANGAGFHMESPWMAAVAEGLTARGFAVLRFNYPYQERGRHEGKPRPPDRTPVLEACHARALEALIERTGDSRPILAGKSLGARMATHLAAKDEPCRGLLLLGYPLHPPKTPGKLRSEHFAAIVQPALFLQGTRDDLCDLELLRRELRRYGGRAEVHVVEGADHGFHVRKRDGRSDQEVLGELLDRAVDWVDAGM